MKSDLVAAVVHELRNPLASVLSWTQLLRSGALPPDKADRGWEAIERSVAVQLRLLDDLVDLSLVTSGELKLALRAVDLGSLLRDAIKDHGAAIDAKRLQLQVSIEPGAGFVSGDSERLHQVARNLIEHAIASTPDGGLVTVALQRAGEQLVLSVRDNGTGMSAERLAQAFEPLRREDGVAHRRWGDLALGLATARHLVLLHGGAIEAASDGPGLGSCITIKLPRLASVPPAA